MWQVLLDKGDYRAALVHCRTPRQRNAVYLAEADQLLDEGQYVTAAELYGRVSGRAPVCVAGGDARQARRRRAGKG